MKFCQKCGAVLDDDAIVCPQCGSVLSEVSGASNATSYHETKYSGVQTKPSASEVGDEVLNDPKVQKFHALRVRKYLLGLLTLILLPVPLMILFAKFFAFNGQNIGDPAFAASLPQTFSIIDAFSFGYSRLDNVYFSIAPAPFDMIPPIALTVGVLIPTTMIIMSALIIPTKKSSALIYQNPKANKEKVLGSIYNAVLAMIATPFLIFATIYIKVATESMTYVYTGGKLYGAGEIVLNGNVITAAIVLAFVLPAVSIAANIVLNTIFVKRKWSE